MRSNSNPLVQGLHHFTIMCSSSTAGPVQLKHEDSQLTLTTLPSYLWMCRVHSPQGVSNTEQSSCNVLHYFGCVVLTVLKGCLILMIACDNQVVDNIVVALSKFTQPISSSNVRPVVALGQDVRACLVMQT